MNLKNSFFNLLLKFSKNIRFFNISKTTHIHISNKSISTYYIPNFIDPEIFVSEESDIKYDILYTGGDLDIKGFSNFIKILKSLNDLDSNISFKIAVIGFYSQEKIQIINENCNNKISITNFGLVSNVSKYINKSRLVIIPIGAPHFCRIAIESGLLNKTFIVNTRFKDLDFITENNCFLIDDWANFSDFYNNLSNSMIQYLKIYLGNL